MPQSTWNKATVPAGTDPYNEIPDTKKALESAGLVFGVGSLTERNGLAAAAPGGVLPSGQTIVRTDTPDGRLERWNGSEWKAGLGTTYVPIWTGIPDLGTGGELTGTYWLNGDLVYVEARAKLGAAATFGTTNSVVRCPLPTGLPIAGKEFLHLGTGTYTPASGQFRNLTVIADAGHASVWVASDPVKTPFEAALSAAQNSKFEIKFWYQTSAIA
jgi:nucleoid-associated protein YgaU